MSADNTNTIERDSILRIMQTMQAQIKELQTILLRLRSTSQPTVYAVLSNGAADMEFDTHTAVKVTPTGNETYTTSVPPAGVRASLLILTSGTSSYTITFGTGFKTTGTLATGVTSARVFALEFISDGTNLYELSRTVAMVA